MSRIIFNKTSILYPRVNILLTTRYNNKIQLSYPVSSGLWKNKLTKNSFIFNIDDVDKLYKNSFINETLSYENIHNILVFSNDFDKKIFFQFCKVRVNIITKIDENSDTVNFFKIF
jgi:hypothetical protein